MKVYDITPPVYGDLYTWGTRTALGLGVEDDEAQYYPRKMAKITVDGINPINMPLDLKWVNMDCGHVHRLAIDINNDLWSWGENDLGQLGTNNTRATCYYPKKIDKIANDGVNPISSISMPSTLKWKQAICGNKYSLAIDNADNLWAWGNNSLGKLGSGSV